MSNTLSHADYPAFLSALKERILAARISAARAINHELVLLYWDIGHDIVGKQQTADWGTAVVERLAADLRAEFPDMRGFSVGNIWRMRQFYQLHTQPEFLAQVPWWHHVELIAKVKDPAAHYYYLRAIAHFGWSRNVLLNQIKGGAYERAVVDKKTHNFALALPEHLAEQADEMLKSRYNLEFLGIGRAMKEREMEDRLIARLQQFILELGYGFCFVGRQYRLALGRREYFVDLLFYHRFLKALVAFDLKIGHFEPEHAGKMDFYLNLLNEKERAPKDDVEVEFALKTKTNPIGVAEYQLQAKLPVEFKGRLPTAKQLAEVVRQAKEE